MKYSPRVPRHSALRDVLRLRSVPVTESGCWLWDGRVDHFGYGQLTYAGESLRAHIAAWRAFKGRIPDGNFICHKCDVPSCCNPEHLFSGSHIENMADLAQKGYHSNRKLSDEAVRDIRTKRLSQSWYVELYGITQGCVSAIQVGRQRKHVQ